MNEIFSKYSHLLAIVAVICVFFGPKILALFFSAIEGVTAKPKYNQLGKCNHSLSTNDEVKKTIKSFFFTGFFELGFCIILFFFIKNLYLYLFLAPLFFLSFLYAYTLSFYSKNLGIYENGFITPFGIFFWSKINIYKIEKNTFFFSTKWNNYQFEVSEELLTEILKIKPITNHSTGQN